MWMFTLGIACLTTSILPWFMDLTFQVPMQYSLQHRTLLSPPHTSTTERHFCFGPAKSFFLELWVINCPLLFPTSILDTFQPRVGEGGAYLPVSYLFSFSFWLWGSCSKTTGVVCHFFLQLTTFCQNSSWWPVHLWWPFTAWLMVSLNYTSPTLV